MTGDDPLAELIGQESALGFSRREILALFAAATAAGGLVAATGGAQQAFASTAYQYPFALSAYDKDDPYNMRPPPPFRRDPHRGVDFNGPFAYWGAPIPAIADGIVVNKNTDLGHRVVIQHPDGNFSGYAHMKDASMHSTGTSVSRGQTIGYVGNTGDVPTHLHLTCGRSVAGANGGGSYEIDHYDPIAYIAARLGGTPTTPTTEVDMKPILLEIKNADLTHQWAIVSPDLKTFVPIWGTSTINTLSTIFGTLVVVNRDEWNGFRVAAGLAPDPAVG